MESKAPDGIWGAASGDPITENQGGMDHSNSEANNSEPTMDNQGDADHNGVADGVEADTAEDQEPTATNVSPQRFSRSNPYSAYVSLDDTSLNTEKLDAKAARSVFQTPQPGQLGFTFSATWFKGAYSTMTINIVAPGVDLDDDHIGTILVKGVSMKTCAHESFTDRNAISEQLGVFCRNIQDNTPLPREIIKLTVEWKVAHIMFHDFRYTFLKKSGSHSALADQLDRIRSSFSQSENMKIGVIFHAGTGDLGYLKTLCAVMKLRSDQDKDKRHPEYPFATVFKASPDVQQLHLGNVPHPGSPEYPKDIDQRLPALDCFDTEEEWLVYNVMGKHRDHVIEVDNAHKLLEMEFDARAIELQHHGGNRFMLYVKTPGGDDVYEPQVNDFCQVWLKGVERVVHSVAPDSLDSTAQDKIAEQLYNISLDAANMRDPGEHIRENCAQFFKAERLTSEIVDQLAEHNEESLDLKRRIEELVNSWVDQDILALTVDQGAGSIVKPSNNCQWWGAERSSSRCDGIPPGYSLYLVTIPLVPADEAPEDRPRPAIDVKFPILKWDDVTSTDPSLFASRVMKHFADKDAALTVTLRVVPSNKTLAAVVSGQNDLHTPQSADGNFPITESTLKMYRFLMNFSGGEMVNVFNKFPHMEYIWTKPKQVPQYLMDFWHSLDETKKEAYRGLNNVRQNIKWIVGVAGSGKTNLIQFMIHMAMFGDKDTVHPLKVLYLVPHNAAVDDFATDLYDKNADTDHKIPVIRLYGFDSEVRDFMRSQIADGQTTDPFDAEEAKRAAVGVDTEFLLQHQLAQLAIDVNDARARARKDKVVYLTLHEAAYAYFKEHQATKYKDLHQALTDINNGALSDEEKDEKRADIKSMVTELYADFIQQFSGVVAATPYTGCASKVARSFKPDLVFLDEAGRVGDPELLMIIRKYGYTLSLLTIVGDPAQGRPFVRSSYGPVVINPWQEQVQRSTIERALNKGGVVDSMLTINHRGYGGLVRLPSKAIYHNVMRPAATGKKAWPTETDAWHEFLVKLCPGLGEINRILIELHGAETGNLGTSPFNLDHVRYVCDIVVKAMKDATLTGLDKKPKRILIMAAYTGQVHHYQVAIDDLVRTGRLSRDERRQIRVRTVDNAQGESTDLSIVDYTNTNRMGFLWDPHRNCVGLTRARQAEILLLPRGIFVGFNRSPEDMPPGYNKHLLPMVYEDVAKSNGIVTEVVAKPTGVAPARENPTNNETVDGESPVVEETHDGGESKSTDQCFNCWEFGHWQQDCTAPMKCGNCGQHGHTSERCPLPTIERCRICRSTEHKQGDCNICETCRQEGHNRRQCVLNIECRECGEKGHKAKNCPTKSNKPQTCNNCGKEGHLKADCNWCSTCNTTEHSNKTCVVNKECRICKQRGHIKVNCPQVLCKICEKLGHIQDNCPDRQIEGGFTRATHVARILPSQVVVENYKRASQTAGSENVNNSSQTAEPQIDELDRMLEELEEVNRKVAANRRAKGRGRHASTVAEYDEGDLDGSIPKNDPTGDGTWGDNGNWGTADGSWDANDDSGTADGNWEASVSNSAPSNTTGIGNSSDVPVAYNNAQDNLAAATNSWDAILAGRGPPSTWGRSFSVNSTQGNTATGASAPDAPINSSTVAGTSTGNKTYVSAWDLPADIPADNTTEFEWNNASPAGAFYESDDDKAIKEYGPGW